MMPPARRPARRLLVALVAALPTVVVSLGAPGATPAAAAPCTMCAGGEYHPLGIPVRILDTRAASASNPTAPINDVAPLGAKPINLTSATTDVRRFDVQLLDVDASGNTLTGYENPWLTGTAATSGDVLAVVVSVVVVGPGSGGYLSAWATGSVPMMPTSVVNFAALQTTSNFAVVRPGSSGRVTMELRGSVAANAHVVIDVHGWYSTSFYRGPDGVESADERGGRTIAVSPGRVLDTGSALVGPASVTELAMRGASTTGATPVEIIPDRPSVTAAVLNVAVSLPTQNTFVSVVPEMPVSGRPATASLNVPAGAVRSSLVIVRIADDGKIRLYNNAGSARLVVDVLGYVEEVPDETRVGRVVPLTSPFRAFDTRTTQFGRVPLGPGQSEEWSFGAFAASVNVAGAAVGSQSGFLGTLTNARLIRQYPTVPVRSNLRVYPSVGSPAVPLIANLNSVEGQAVANLAMVRYGTDGKVWVFNFAGYAHYVLDIAAVILAD